MAQKFFSLNCGCFKPFGAKAMWNREELPCRCLLIEGKNSLTLVDAGYNPYGISQTKSFIQKNVLGAHAEKSETASEQIKKLGYELKDVQNIIITHLDPDHTGDLINFPWATVHMHTKELETAGQIEKFPKFKERFWPHLWKDAKIKTHDITNETWRNFSSTVVLNAIDDDLLLIPMPGHTMGHCGVATKLDDQWILHCGDAFYLGTDLLLERKGLSNVSLILGEAMAFNNKQRLQTLQKIRDYKAQYTDTQITNSHDSELTPNF